MFGFCQYYLYARSFDHKMTAKHANNCTPRVARSVKKTQHVTMLVKWDGWYKLDWADVIYKVHACEDVFFLRSFIHPWLIAYTAESRHILC